MRSSTALRAWAAGALGYWIRSAAAGLLLLGNPFDESGDPSTMAVASIAGFNATLAPAILLLLFFAPVFLAAIPLVGWLVWRLADPGAW